MTLPSHEPTRNQLGSHFEPWLTLLGFIWIPGFTFISVGALLSLCYIVALAITARPIGYARWILLSSIAGACGLVTAYFRDSEQSISNVAEVQMLAWLLSYTCLAIVAARATRIATVRRLGILCSIGILIGTFLKLGMAFSWKGGFGFGLTLFVISLVSASRVLSIITCSIVSAISLAFDARSLAVMALLGMIASLVPDGIRAQQARSHRTAIVATILLAPVLVQFATTAMEDGWLGTTVQARTLHQTQSTHKNIILAGRQEWNATLSLMRSQPLGFGTGVTPNWEQYSRAIWAVARAGGDTHSDYFSRTVFSQRVDLHSTLAGMWFHFGLVGLFQAVSVGVVLLSNVIRRLGSRYVALLVFLAAAAAWDLLFSPMAGAGAIAVAFGLLAGLPEAGGAATLNPSAKSHRGQSAASTALTESGFKEHKPRLPRTAF